MALRKLLILRRPRSGRLEGRTTLNPGSRRFSDSLRRDDEEVDAGWLGSAARYRRIQSSRAATAKVALSAATDFETTFGVSSTNSNAPSSGNVPLTRTKPSGMTQRAKALTPRPAITAPYTPAKLPRDGTIR